MKYFLFSLIIGSTLASEKSICFEDDRELSYNLKVGRMRKSLTSSNPCTATLIGSKCLITAGHCLNSDSWITEFNTSPSHPVLGAMNPSAKEDIYSLDKVIAFENKFKGKDWAVFTVKKNKLTGKFPGDVYGYYEVSNEPVLTGTEVAITGYGLDKEEEKTKAQQLGLGAILNVKSNITELSHSVDTQSGNSGSSIIDIRTNKIIGIHTHGGCFKRGDSLGGGNHGTLIHGNEPLLEAIKSCLEL